MKRRDFFKILFGGIVALSVPVLQKDTVTGFRLEPGKWTRIWHKEDGYCYSVWVKPDGDRLLGWGEQLEHKNIRNTNLGNYHPKTIELKKKLFNNCHVEWDKSNSILGES
jgi:hypothetical protein